jgi:hypothetical protein
MRIFSSRKFLSISFTLLSIIGYGFIVFASAPTGGYLPGQILDPDCSPGETVPTPCIVTTYQLTTATNYTWLGTGAGTNGSNDNTVYIGIGAGTNTPTASNSNMVGTNAGNGATDADNVNFFGPSAGCFATNADDSNFFGLEAGCYAAHADNSNFFGNRSGYYAIDADHSVAFGDHAGFGANEAKKSNFIGYRAGYNNTFSNIDDNVAGTFSELSFDAERSNFFGYESGFDATHASNSNYMGYQAGYEATNAAFSNFFGSGAGYRAYEASNSLMMGFEAGKNARDIPTFLDASMNQFHLGGGAVYVGYQAGYGADQAVDSTLIGAYAGYKANTALGSTIIGYGAGTNTNYSTFDSPVLAASVVIGDAIAADTLNTKNLIVMGNGTFNNSTNVDDSIIIGTNSAAVSMDNVHDSIIMGSSAAAQSTNVIRSIILGTRTGQSVIAMNNGIFIGTSAGNNSPINNTFSTLSYTPVSGTFKAGETIIGSTSHETSEIVADNGSVLKIQDLFPSFILHETITGVDSHATATIDTISIGTTSIVIGTDSDTGGYQNSIALGTDTSNTANNQFMIGSDSFPINEIKVIQANGTQCIINLTGLGCTSDERLKTNIQDLNNSVLDDLVKVRTVTYNWKANPSGDPMIGFLAQDLEQYFPQLVNTDGNGYKTVNYAVMTPILTEAVRELNLKINNIESIATLQNQTFKDSLIAWFGDAGNGIVHLVAGLIEGDTIKAKNELCVGARCITEDQFNQLLDQSSITPSPAPVPISDPQPTPDPVPVPGPTPTPVPDPVPTPDPAPVPDPTPTPDPVPSSDGGSQTGVVPAPVPDPVPVS